MCTVYYSSRLLGVSAGGVCPRGGGCLPGGLSADTPPPRWIESQTLVTKHDRSLSVSVSGSVNAPDHMTRLVQILINLL